MLTPEQMTALGRKSLIEPETEVSPDGKRWVRASQVKGLIPPNPPPAAKSVTLDTEMRAIVVTEPIVPVIQPASSSREPWHYGFLTGYAGLLMFRACLSIVGGIALAALTVSRVPTGMSFAAVVFLGWGMAGGLLLLLMSSPTLLLVDIGRRLRRRPPRNPQDPYRSH
jgi:hypothetical protein